MKVKDYMDFFKDLDPEMEVGYIFDSHFIKGSVSFLDQILTLL